MLDHISWHFVTNYAIMCVALPENKRRKKIPINKQSSVANVPLFVEGILFLQGAEDPIIIKSCQGKSLLCFIAPPAFPKFLAHQSESQLSFFKH